MDEVVAAGRAEAESVVEHAYLVEVETVGTPDEYATGAADELLPTGEAAFEPPLARFHTAGPGMV